MITVGVVIAIAISGCVCLLIGTAIVAIIGYVLCHPKRKGIIITCKNDYACTVIIVYVAIILFLSTV